MPASKKNRQTGVYSEKKKSGINKKMTENALHDREDFKEKKNERRVENGMKQMIRKNFVFYGRVQGVGFRYRAKYAASLTGVTGWVKNRWDDTVEMELQGTEEAIDRTLLMLEQGSFIRIERMDVFSVAVRMDESRFRAEDI